LRTAVAYRPAGLVALALRSLTVSRGDALGPCVVWFPSPLKHRQRAHRVCARKAKNRVSDQCRWDTPASDIHAVTDMNDVRGSQQLAEAKSGVGHVKLLLPSESVKKGGNPCDRAQRVSPQVGLRVENL